MGGGGAGPRGVRGTHIRSGNRTSAPEDSLCCLQPPSPPPWYPPSRLLKPDFSHAVFELHWHGAAPALCVQLLLSHICVRTTQVVV